MEHLLQNLPLSKRWLQSSGEHSTEASGNLRAQSLLVACSELDLCFLRKHCHVKKLSLLPVVSRQSIEALLLPISVMIWSDFKKLNIPLLVQDGRQQDGPAELLPPPCSPLHRRPRHQQGEGGHDDDDGCDDDDGDDDGVGDDWYDDNEDCWIKIELLIDNQTWNLSNFLH